MYKITLILFFTSQLAIAYSQGNRVFSGGEIINYNIVDISAKDGLIWSTERSSKPGFFSVINNGVYIGCSDDANINGYIKKYGNSSFIFPVGSGDDIRTLEISAPDHATDVYATAWIKGDPSLNLDPTSPHSGSHSVYSFAWPIIAVSTVGQWDWMVGDSDNLAEGSTGTGEGLSITVSIPDMTHFAPASYLRLVGWNGFKWINLSDGTAATGNTENSSLRGMMVAGITAIGIGMAESSLSIDLQKFIAQSSNCKTILEWKSSNEINTEVFLVEQSLDATHFNTIAEVKATGLTIGNTYSLSVDQPRGIAYYRLKIKSNDGYFTYSSIITHRNNCHQSDYMLVYPNPVSTHEKLNIRFGTDYLGKADIIIFNSIGQNLKTTPIHVIAGPNQLSLDVQGLTAGTYFIIVLGESGTQIGDRQKFIIQ